jgi:hypothetical protein
MPRIGSAQHTDLPGRNRRDEYAVGQACANDRGRRCTGHRVAIGEPYDRACVQKHGTRRRVAAHRWILRSSAAKRSSVAGAVKSTSGGMTTDPRKNPCSASTASVFTGGDTRTPTAAPRLVMMTRSSSRRLIRSSMSRHLVLNSVTPSVSEPAIALSDMVSWNDHVRDATEIFSRESLEAVAAADTRWLSNPALRVATLAQSSRSAVSVRGG